MTESSNDMPDWPADALRHVPACPVCGSEDRWPLHLGLRDQLLHVPGTWALATCGQCGSAWLDPRPEDAHLGLAYAGYFTHSAPQDRVIVRRKGLVRRALHSIVNGYLAARYQVHRSPRGAGWLLYVIPPLRATCDAMCRHLPSPPNTGGRLLDVGCGNGGFLLLAREMGWNAEGLDFDEAAATQARSFGFKVTVGGIETLAGQGGGYDVITSSHVLEHVPDPSVHLRTLFSLLKPGGVLWLQTPNIESLGARMYGCHWRALEPPRHLVLFNSKSLRQSLSEAGFIDIRDKRDSGQAFVVLRASEAIRRGTPVENSSRNKSRLPLELAMECIEWCLPATREFLTITCRKPEA